MPLLVIVLACFIVAMDARAMNAGMLRLETLSLEELLRIRVTVASKRDERVRDAPAIITVVTRDEIRAYGARDVTDLLNRLPNTQYIKRFGFFFNSRAGIRQQNAQSGGFDRTTLILLNGRPVRDGINGGQYSTFYLGFPIDAIERLEVIRGPGSVLYGTNAFSGVINVVTQKSDHDTSEARVSLTGGSFGTIEGASTGHYKSGDLELFFSGKILDNKGEDFGVVADTGDPNGGPPAGRTSDKKWETDVKSVYASAGYKGLSLDVFYSALDLMSLGPGALFAVDANGNVVSALPKVNHLFIDGGYTAPLSDQITGNANFTYNRRELTSSEVGPTKSDDFLSELSIQGKFLDTVTVIAGGIFEINDFGPGLVFKDKRHEWNFYTQMDWKPIESLKFVGGLQLNDPEKVKINISPRAAIVYTPTEAWGAKLLYSEAFREASPSEILNNSPQVLAPGSLDPETIKTVDAQISYEQSRWMFSATGYWSRIEKKIGVVPTQTVPPNTVVNLDSIDYWGIELEGKHAITNDIRLEASYSYQQSESENGENNPTFVGQSIFKSGVRYERNAFTLGVFNSYYSSPRKIRGATKVNARAGDFSLLSINAAVDLSYYLKSKTKLRFNLLIDNALDKEITIPESVRGLANSTPVRSGIGVWGSIQLAL